MDNSTDTSIKVTTNYEQFRFLINNRDRYRGHIEALKRAMTERGNLTEVQPILVNENFDIIDGQHRFIAAKELGQPVYYVVGPGLRIEDARSMNILNRSWTFQDYAQSYADGGDASYKRYLDLQEDYGYGHSTLLSYITGHEEKGIFKTFRNGEFVFPPEAVTATRERLDKLAEFGEKVPYDHDKQFALAVLKVINVPGYEHARMLAKLEQHGDTIRRFSAIADYLRALEEVYNFRMSESSRLRLY
jgi:hypothetical protein